MAIRQALEAELAAAMRRRDTAVVRVLRTALAALGNAEASPAARTTGTAVSDTPHIAGAARGLGATEAPRSPVDEEEQRVIVAAEAAELAGHVDRLTRLCRLDEADGARRGLRVLTDLLDDA